MKQIKPYFKRALLSLLALMATAMGTKADDMTTTPLTLEAVEAGTINIVNQNELTLAYTSSVNGAQASSANPITIEVAKGETIALECNNTTMGTNFNISTTNDVYVYGNALSLVFGSDFAGKTDLSACETGILGFLFCLEPDGNILNSTILNHPTKDIVLPATTLGNGCYFWMFSGCNNLTRGPQLPATTLAEDCYHRMFEYTGLVMAPELPAATLFGQVYGGMFDHCKNLRYVKCLATDIGENVGIYSSVATWLNGVAPSGTFIKADGMDDWTVGPQDEWGTIDGIPAGWTVKNASDFDPYATPLTLEAATSGDVTFQMQVGYYSSSSANDIEYRKNDGEWTTYTWNEPIAVNAGDKIAFRGDNATYNGNGDFSSRITSTADVYVYGNVMSLVKSQNFATLTTLEKPWTFGELFCVGYDDMHQSITNTTIKNHPTKDIVLPATTLTNYCYYSMFDGCGGITRAPELPAKKMTVACYADMFRGTGLTKAPALPATEFDDYSFDPETWEEFGSIDCYMEMFANCKSLVEAPALPATTLVHGVYQLMFSGCTNLKTAPDLPASKVAEVAYYRMFYGCSKLNYVKCLATDITEEMAVEEWLDGVSTTGTFVKSADMDAWPTGANGIPEGWTVEEESGNAADAGEPLTFVAVEAGTITVKYEYYGDAPSGNINTIQYKLNNDSWTYVTWDEDIALAANDVISFRGDNTSCYDTENWEHFYFVCSNDCYVYGNVMSLLHSTTFATETTLTDEYCFSDLFCNQWEENTTIKNHPTKDIVLPATTLTDYCYNSMFNGCAGLTRAPELPATIMTAYCYNDMFNGCKSLAEAPALPATTLAEGCYTFMFNGCSSLATAPALPATALASMCYDGIFMDCTNLTTAPELPATTLVDGCYSEMFMGCTSLTTAPELPAQTLEEMCYNYMFNGCTNLNYVKCLATDISADNCTYGWLTDVAATGTFVKAADTDWSGKVPTTDGWGDTQVNGIPEGWTVVAESDPGTYAFTVPASGLGTFSADEAVAVPAGLTAYYCTTFDADASTITIKAIEGNVIPAATGVLLSGQAGQSFTLETAGEAAEPITDNSLVAVTTATHVPATSGDYTNFMLTGGRFVKIQDADSNVKMPANKAYLQIPTASIVSVARPITLIWDETTTAIADVKRSTSNVQRSTFNVQRSFDLQGRHVNAQRLQKGLYIVYGKKVYINK
ncbi:MAG: leucine-rich repeat protein [Prevotella sp.]|nr:leucine-rich repeat protein [Prevotella sp.]